MPDQLNHTALNTTLAGLCDAPAWYVGFSGGLDSTVLLHLLHRWHKANPGAPPLRAIHVNHGLQEQASEWQNHCDWMCQFLQVPFEAEQVDVETDGKGIEAAARDARYQVFSGRLEEGAVLFLAHHLDDQVETFFLRLLRGAGARGLAAMPLQRPLGLGTLVRPLLETPRSDLEAYAREQGLQCIEDPSNADTTLDRNFLRADLLPLLAQRWPGSRRTVARASEHLGAASRALDAAAPAPPTEFSILGDPGLGLETLVDPDTELAAGRMRNWLQRGGLPAPAQSNLLEFLRQLRDGTRQANPQLRCSAYQLQLYRQAVYLHYQFEEPPSQPVTILPGQSIELPGAGQVALVPAPSEGLFLGDGEVLQLSFRKGGERCQPAGRGRSNSLKKLLQESAVPPWWRDRIPLLYLGSELLAAGGLWCCQCSRIREQPEGEEVLWKLHWQPLLPTGFD